MHRHVVNVINVRLRPTQLCLTKCRSLSIVCIIGYCLCFAVAYPGKCYQRRQLGKVCHKDPVAVGITRGKKPISHPLFGQGQCNLSPLSKQSCWMFERPIWPSQNNTKITVYNDFGLDRLDTKIRLACSTQHFVSSLYQQDCTGAIIHLREKQQNVCHIHGLWVMIMVFSHIKPSLKCHSDCWFMKTGSGFVPIFVYWGKTLMMNNILSFYSQRLH